MSEMTTIARPYAKAAFAYAVENNAVDSWQEMIAFAAEVSQNDSVDEMLTGSLAPESLADLFIKVCDEQLDQYGQNFIKVLAENRRLQVLPDILVVYSELKAEFEKTIDVEVTSATELSDKQKAEISASLEKKLERKVQLNCNVDSELLAGVVIKAGDTVIDGSVKSKLSRLSDALQA